MKKAKKFDPFKNLVLDKYEQEIEDAPQVLRGRIKKMIMQYSVTSYAKAVYNCWAPSTYLKKCYGWEGEGSGCQFPLAAEY